jgi:3-deoxy-D-manno-octulosonic-acid transferase
MKKVLSLMDFIYMQSKGNAERIISIGAQPEKVGVMGNFKFDINFNSNTPLEWIKNIEGRILLAGSTHKGEDEIILDAYQGLNNTFPDLKLIIAPRHPERFSEVESLIRDRKLKYIKRSKIKTSGKISEAVILLDTIGELPRSFAGSAVTFIGGSLLPYGGHNILEPAYWSTPIISGPHMENFPIHREFLEKSAALIVKNSSDIIDSVSGLLNDPQEAEEMGGKGKAIVDSNTGAVDKAITLIRSYFGTA